MISRVYLFFPFDLGLELDFTGKDMREFFKEISTRKMGVLSFEDRVFSQAEFSTQVYKFGVGMICISFDLDGELSYMARLVCDIEKIKAGKSGIIQYCHSLVEGLVQRASKYATYKYDKRYQESELFPVVLLKESLHSGAEIFIQENRKALFGMTAGEQDYDSLSEFVLKEEKLVNYGYYENEIFLVKRFGAVVFSTEASEIIEMIKLAFAQYWSMRAYNFLLDHELDVSQKLLDNIPPYYKIWKIWGAYQRFSREAIDFSKDKIAIVDSLYNSIASVAKVESDWHLNTVHQKVNKVFSIEELHKTVETKIDRIEQSYNSAREFLSTNFFILLDIIFFLSLAWSIFDTWLLFKISTK